MGLKVRNQIALKQKNKRRKKRIKLSKTGQNPDESFYTGTWVGKRSTES